MNRKFRILTFCLIAITILAENPPTNTSEITSANETIIPVIAPVIEPVIAPVIEPVIAPETIPSSLSHTAILGSAPEINQLDKSRKSRFRKVKVMSPAPEEEETIIQSTSVTIRKIISCDAPGDRGAHQTIIQNSANSGNKNTIIQGIVSDGMRAGLKETITQSAENFGENDNIGPQPEDMNSGN